MSEFNMFFMVIVLMILVWLYGMIDKFNRHKLLHSKIRKRKWMMGKLLAD